MKIFAALFMIFYINHKRIKRDPQKKRSENTKVQNTQKYKRKKRTIKSCYFKYSNFFLFINNNCDIIIYELIKQKT